jgi:hypothetical protein
MGHFGAGTCGPGDVRGRLLSCSVLKEVARAGAKYAAVPFRYNQSRSDQYGGDCLGVRLRTDKAYLYLLNALDWCSSQYWHTMPLKELRKCKRSLIEARL